MLAKAKEVRKYLEPSLTMTFGIAAVPDAVFELSSGILAEVYQLNVVLVSYSMFVPYLLLVFETVLKSSQNIDLDKLSAYLQTAQQSVLAVQEELQGRFSRGPNNARQFARRYDCASGKDRQWTDWAKNQFKRALSVAANLTSDRGLIIHGEFLGPSTTSHHQESRSLLKPSGNERRRSQ